MFPIMSTIVDSKLDSVVNPGLKVLKMYFHRIRNISLSYPLRHEKVNLNMYTSYNKITEIEKVEKTALAIDKS